MWIGVVLTLGLSITSQAQTPKTCWESMLGITPGLSADFGCVKNAAGFQISLLCSEDGIAFKQTFQSYMNERQQYEAALIAYGK